MAEIKITVDIPEELITRITDALRPTSVVTSIASEQQLEPVKEEPVKATAVNRTDLKKFLMTRYNEGVNIADIIRTVGHADKFSAIPDELLEEVYEAVKNA